MTTKKKPKWPWDKPLPAFSSEAAEVKFWHAYDFEDPPEECYQPLPRSFPWPLPESLGGRKHSLTVRINSEEQAIIKQAAKATGVSEAGLVRQFIHGLAPKKKPTKNVAVKKKPARKRKAA